MAGCRVAIDAVWSARPRHRQRLQLAALGAKGTPWGDGQSCEHQEQTSWHGNKSSKLEPTPTSKTIQRQTGSFPNTQTFGEAERLERRNVAGSRALARMTSAVKIDKPLARAIKIYCNVAKHGLDTRTRYELAKHIEKMAEQGERDQSRLTVHGLAYLRSRNRGPMDA